MLIDNSTCVSIMPAEIAPFILTRRGGPFGVCVPTPGDLKKEELADSA